MWGVQPSSLATSLIKAHPSTYGRKQMHNAGCWPTDDQKVTWPCINYMIVKSRIRGTDLWWISLPLMITPILNLHCSVLECSFSSILVLGSTNRELLCYVNWGGRPWKAYFALHACCYSESSEAWSQRVSTEFHCRRYGKVGSGRDPHQVRLRSQIWHQLG